MSQTNMSLLDEVMQWSQETCSQELKTVLPKLTSLHRNSETWSDHIRILKIITDMFLPHIRISELERECFSKILPKKYLVAVLANRIWLLGLEFDTHGLKTVAMFESMIKEVTDQVGELSSQNTELCAFLRSILQASMQIIDVLSHCVRHVASLEEAPDLYAIRSLPTNVLKVLRKTFQHCKDSEVIYCGRLSLVADLLQGLFKDAYALQKGLLDLIDKISLDNSASEEQISDIVAVIHSLLDICSIISDLDIALHANTWKFLIKQSLKYQALVEEHLRHGDISGSLCENLLSAFHSCVDLAVQITQTGLQDTPQSAEYKLFQKTAKMLRFFANTLVHYIKEFKCFLTKYCDRFHKLYLQILSKLPPSLSAPSLPTALSEELIAAALIPMDALLLQLLLLRPFVEVVLQQDLCLSPEQELPQCLLLVNVMVQLAKQPEDVLQLWYTGSQFSEDTPRLPLYQAVFTSFRRCHTERTVPVLLPGIMLKGQAQVQVTLHHHVCVQLCASVAVLPTVHLPVLERSLIGALLQADTHTALLAVDVWCFTARYGSADLCLHHVLLMAQLVKMCRADCYQSLHLGMMLKRMIFLMTPNHQVEFVAAFPPSDVENLTVWNHVLLKALSHDSRHRVEAEIISLTDKVVTEWKKGGFKLGHVNKVNAVLVTLLAVLHGQQSPEEQCVLSAVRIVTQLWLRMDPDQLRIHRVLQATLRSLLSISAILIKNLEPQVVGQALLCLDEVVCQRSDDQLLLAALEFLSSMGKIFIPPESQCHILPRVSRLLGKLLAGGTWLLHHRALEAFSYFAENTNHEEVISQSLCVEDTKSKVLSYLSKTVNAPQAEESRLQRLKQESQVIEEQKEKLELNGEDFSHQPSPEVSADSEPCLKRPRQESSTEEECSRYIQTAESALKALWVLTDCKTNSPPPPWLESRLTELQTLITKISTHRHAS